MCAYRSNQLPVKTLGRLVAMYRRASWARAMPSYFLTFTRNQLPAVIPMSPIDEAVGRIVLTYFQRRYPSILPGNSPTTVPNTAQPSLLGLQILLDTLAVGRVCLRVAVPESRDNVPQGPFEASLLSIPMHPCWFPTTTTSTAMADRGRDAGPASSFRLLNLGHTTPTRIIFITTMPTYRSHHDRIHSVQPPMLSQLWHIMADDDDNGVRQRRDALMFLCSVDFNVADNGSLDENHSACCDGGAALSHLAQLQDVGRR
ncbi:hypothetical protein BJV78DRAFT_1158425 [Lactifluus subvellereus]|nr:hypothetical protein BJV78DRAFT_1158425 [Lactifluus subvellereus]